MLSRKLMLGAALVLLAACAAAARGEDRTISLESLLGEMIDRQAVARYPDPPYLCKHESSYDRRSKTPDDPAGWFANEDNMEGMHIPMKWEDHQSRRECVMMDVDGPGAVVRFWTGGKKPEGKVRFYLDGAEAPAIERRSTTSSPESRGSPSPWPSRTPATPATCTCRSPSRSTARSPTTRPIRRAATCAARAMVQRRVPRVSGGDEGDDVYDGGGGQPEGGHPRRCGRSSESSQLQG